ncbi:MAG TPA: hypothetical protein DDW49_05560 [Deltaproteobacteria bacterium]|nr:MAG: hypothetical protein A2048_06275 [Deltaproteobacteria bacterium GWA2_45_12]HBF12842.1 hypothetical protein [Deltaproteobacteria bacterium]
MEQQPIKITAEPQMEGNVCKFTLEKPLVEAGSFRFENRDESKNSVLAQKLFSMDQVTQVFITANSVFVTVQGMADWRMFGKQMGGLIREAVGQGQPLVNPDLINTLPSEEEIRKTVTEVLEHEINPAVASHGGVIELLDVRKNDVFVKMGGGCHGCASSTATLKQGVEQAIRKRIPKIGAIYDTTDHAAGLNPYFRPEGSCH